MRLVFLPESEALFLWAETSTDPPLPAEQLAWRDNGQPHRATLVTPEGRQEVLGALLPLIETAAALALLPGAALESLPVSVASWSLASKLALDLIARERVVPTIRRVRGRMQARWAAALSA